MFQRFHWIPIVLLPTTGCGAAGSTSYERLSTAYDHPAQQAPMDHTDPASSVDGPALDRARFVQAVLRRNPSIESARQAFRAALSRVRQAGAFEDPMVDLGVAPLSFGSSRARVGYQVGISQRLPWFGKRGLEAAAAEAEAEAARSDFEATRRELALAAVVLYEQYYVTDESIDVNAHHAELLRALRASAAAQFEAGRGSAQDPLQAEAVLAGLERDSAVLAAQRDVTIAQMNELMHRAPDERLPPPPKNPPLLPGPDLRDPKAAQREAVKERTEIAAARQRARAAEARAERAGREYLPDFTVSTTYNSMWDMPEHRWMVGLGFNLPLFASARAAAGDEARAMRAQYESEAARLEDSARAQAFIALKRLDESKQVLELFENRLLPVAKDQVDAARAGFIVSRNPFVAVMEAERNLRDVELDYLMARAEWNKRRAELDRALGRIPGLALPGGDR